MAKNNKKKNKIETFLVDMNEGFRNISIHEAQAMNEGRCSCPQSLWYLNILERIDKILEESKDVSDSDTMDSLCMMWPEIERAIKFGKGER